MAQIVHEGDTKTETDEQQACELFGVVHITQHEPQFKYEGPTGDFAPAKMPWE